MEQFEVWMDYENLKSTHTWKSKHKDRYSIKKESGEHSRWQQECTDVERRTMDQKNDSRDNSIMKKGGERKLKFIRKYTKK